MPYHFGDKMKGLAEQVHEKSKCQLPLRGLPSHGILWSALLLIRITCTTLGLRLLYADARIASVSFYRVMWKLAINRNSPP